MRAGIDIGIDPQRADRPLAARRCNCGKLDAFFFAFKIELANTRLKPLNQFMRLLAHARKDDVLSRHASRQRARQLSARNDIGAKPFALHHFEHGQVGVGLDCKGDVRIGQMRQCRLEHPRVAFQRGA